MKCPVCKTSDLLMAERRSVEIDYCAVCRGVWLDRGELDKLIKLEGAMPDTSALPRSSRDESRDRDGHRNDHGRNYDEQRSGEHGHRRKRLLFDMFDFD